MNNSNQPESSQSPPQQSFWWSNKFAVILALALFVCGVITAISISPSLILGGILQIICSLTILVIEAPSFVPCVAFAAPIGSAIDRKPAWLKVVLYGGLTILPLVLCGLITGVTIGVFFLLGFLANLAIFGIYAKTIIIGTKAERDAMRTAAATTGGGVFP